MVSPTMRGSRRKTQAFGLAQVAMLPVGAYAVHQLRYLFAFGGNAGTVLRETGHSYLGSVVPWLILLVGLIVGSFLRALGRAFAGHTSVRRYGASLGALWLTCTLCLIAIFTVQELLEGLLATGHPTGWVGVFGFGGWWAVPAAAMVGLVLASLFHGALWVLRVAETSAARRRRPTGAKPVGSSRPADALRPRIPPLTRGWSNRGPPLWAGAAESTRS